MPLTSSSARCTSLVARTAASTEGNSLPPREKTTTHDGDQAYSAHGRGACCVLWVARSALRVVCCVLCAMCFVLCCGLLYVADCGWHSMQSHVPRIGAYCCQIVCITYVSLQVQCDINIGRMSACQHLQKAKPSALEGTGGHQQSRALMGWALPFHDHEGTN